MNQTRESIKAIALKMFNSQGVDHVNTRDIAGKLKISPGNLTYHFRTKSDLIEELCKDLIKNVDEAFVQLNTKPESDNTLVFFYQQCKCIGEIQQKYQFIFDKRYAEIITSIPEIQNYYQEALKRRFEFYKHLHSLMVKQKLAVPQLVKETNSFGYLINILGLFWHQEMAIYFPDYKADEKLKHSLTVFFQIYKPYLTNKGRNALKPYMIELKAY